MNLAALNENNPVPPQYKAAMGRLLAPHPGAVGGGATRSRLRRGVVRGHRPRGPRPGPGRSDALLTHALKDAGCRRPLLAAADDASRDEPSVRATSKARTGVGAETGSPITAFDDGPAFFGPVVSPAPNGAAALDQWDGLAG